MIALLCFLFVGSIYSLANLRTSSDDIKDQYVVVFKKTLSTAAFEGHLKHAKHSPYGGKIKHIYRHVLKGYSVELNEEQLAELRLNPNIDFIEGDKVVHIADCTDQASDSWGQTRICQEEINLDGNYAATQTAGEGVDAYVMDTGVFLRHDEFRTGRATNGFRAEESWNFEDANGHGTHVSSTIAGLIYGVAKKAHIINVKVLGDNGFGTWTGVIAGMDFVVVNQQKTGKPSVVNLSLGGPRMDSVNMALDNAVSAGITFVVAAGNNNDDSCNYSPSGASKALTVGASDIGNQNGIQKDVRSTFSNYGTCVDIFAPGSNIKGAWIGNHDATNIISGTSMAAPHVCGAAALLLGDQPSLTPEQVTELLTGDATSGKLDLRCTRPACNSSPNKLLFNGCLVTSQ